MAQSDEDKAIEAAKAELSRVDQILQGKKNTENALRQQLSTLDAKISKEKTFYGPQYDRFVGNQNQAVRDQLLGQLRGAESELKTVEQERTNASERLNRATFGPPPTETAGARVPPTGTVPDSPQTPPAVDTPQPSPKVDPPSDAGAATAQKYNLAADQAQQRSTELESNIKETVATRKDLQNQAIDAAATGDLAKEAQIKQQIAEVDKEYASLNTQLAQSNATLDRAQNLANESLSNPNASTVPAPVETVQTGSGGQLLSGDGTPVFTGTNPVPSPKKEPVGIAETEAEQEARFERERLDAVARQEALQEARERGGIDAGPPTITQGPPAGIPPNPLDDDGNLLPGWVEGPNNTVAYVGIDAATNSGALLTKAPVVLPTSILPYDDDGNLQPGWKLGVDGLPFRDPNYPGGGPPVLPERSPIPIDDQGNLMPGWIERDGEYVHDPDYDQVDLGAEAVKGIKASKAQGLSGEKAKAQSSAQTNTTAIKNQPDWRVRLQLAQRADYLYLAKSPGILKPLQSTNGILFPYLPTVSVGYTATYDNQALTHTNYRVLQYTNSTVDNVQVNADFTAQSTEEANYVLAVIHFMRTITKMFYGQDQNPIRGTPPPLVYLTGYGEFQYNRHPLVITSFTYSLPTDVDYIRADSQLIVPGTPTASDKKAPSTTNQSKQTRQETSKVPTGGYPLKPQWQKPAATDSVTYVPTKMTISFTGIPVVSRSDVSREFSVRDFATGKLTTGRNRPQNRGLW